MHTFAFFNSLAVQKCKIASEKNDVFTSYFLSYGNFCVTGRVAERKRNRKKADRDNKKNIFKRNALRLA